tara:strand:- start:16 stop:345 length:330 start_codon:yes stop_codon:yes gene_type:complete
MKTLLALLLLIPSLSWGDRLACSYEGFDDSGIVNVIIEKKGNHYLASAGDTEIKLSYHEKDNSIRFVNYKDMGVILSILIEKSSMIGQISSMSSYYQNTKKITCTSNYK